MRSKLSMKTKTEFRFGKVELKRSTLEAIKKEYKKEREFVHCNASSGDILKRKSDGKFILGMYNISQASGGLVFEKPEFVDMLKKYFPEQKFEL